MNELVLKSMIITGGVICILYGIWHFFVPRLFHWDLSERDIPDLIADSILAANFTMCLSIVISGIVDLAAALYFWRNSELVRVLLAMQIILLVIRIVYALIKPMRFPRTFFKPLFIAIFFLILILFFLPWFSLSTTFHFFGS